MEVTFQHLELQRESDIRRGGAVIASVQRTYIEDPEVLAWSGFGRAGVEAMSAASIRRWEGAVWSFVSHSGRSGEKAFAFFLR